MATLDKGTKMPKLQKYFADQLPKLPAKTDVWNAFLKWSGHQLGGKPTPEAAKQAALGVIAASGGPKVTLMATITADPKNSANTERSANGIFFPKQPDAIGIKLGIASFFDDNIDSKSHQGLAIQLLESTCLHEFVHLLNFKHHKKVRGFTGDDGNEIKEIGKAFEKEAYGKDVGSEGWMRLAARAGAAIPASVAAGMQVYEETIVRVEINPPVLVGKRVHKLSPNVVVTIDGRAKKLTDLKPGQRVRVTPVRIEALDKNKEFQK